LRDFKPELEQFAVDARRSPKRILDAHPPDQRTEVRLDLRLGSMKVGPLLQRNQNASIIEQRCAGLSPGSADWKYQIAPNPRRASSPLRAGLGFRYTQRGVGIGTKETKQPQARRLSPT
jgi:hypothetical protein